MEAVCSCLRSYKRAVEFSTVVLMDVDSVVGDGLQAWGCVRVCVCVCGFSWAATCTFYSHHRANCSLTTVHIRAVRKDAGCVISD